MFLLRPIQTKLQRSRQHAVFTTHELQIRKEIENTQQLAKKAKRRVKRIKEKEEDKKFWDEEREKYLAEQIIHVGSMGGKYRVVDGKKRYDVPG